MTRLSRAWLFFIAAVLLAIGFACLAKASSNHPPLPRKIFAQIGPLPGSGPLAAFGAASTSCTTPTINATSLMHLDGSNGATSTTDVYSHTISGTNAQLETAHVQFGTAGMTNTGTTAGNGFTVGSASADFQYSTAAFTIDFWYFYSSTDNTNNAALLTNGSDGGGIRWRLGSGTSNKLTYYYNSATTTGTASLAGGGWFHLAAAKDGSNNMRFFVNGVADSTVTTASVTVTSSVGLQIGGENTGTSMPSIAGDEDEVRTIKGTAYWTTGFTPPTLPWCS